MILWQCAPLPCILPSPCLHLARTLHAGHDVPGEGEHKIMEYIRWEKRLPTYQPNQVRSEVVACARSGLWWIGHARHIDGVV